MTNHRRRRNQRHRRRRRTRPADAKKRDFQHRLQRAAETNEHSRAVLHDYLEETGRRWRRKKRRIAVYEETTHPEDDEEDYPEQTTEWIDEKGVVIELDRWDAEDEGLTIAKKAAKFLHHEGAYEPSSSSFHKGTWYTTNADEDYRTGEYRSRSYFLKDFSEKEEREIFELMQKRRQR